MKTTIDRRNINFIRYLEYLQAQEGKSTKYCKDVKRVFKSFLMFYQEKWPEKVAIKKCFGKTFFYVRRIITKAIHDYIKQLKVSIATKNKEFYILKKYALFFNKDHRCSLKFSKIYKYKENKRCINKNIYKLIMHLKDNDLHEDLLCLYFTEYLGISLYTLALLRADEIKFTDTAVKIVYIINRAKKIKVVAKELYDAVKNKVINAIKSGDKLLFYSNIKNTAKISRRKKIEKNLNNLLKKSGISSNDAIKILESLTKERKSKVLTKKEKLAFQQGIELGMGALDSELSVFNN